MSQKIIIQKQIQSTHSFVIYNNLSKLCLVHFFIAFFWLAFPARIFSQVVRNYESDTAIVADPYADKSKLPKRDVLEVSKVGKDKSKLIKVFNLIREKYKSDSVKKYKVVQRLGSRRFLISVGDGVNGLLITLDDKGVVDGEQIEVNGMEKTDEIFEYTTVLNAKATVAVFKESGEVVDFTQEQFIRRLKSGEVWMIREFEKIKCTNCGGDGVAGTPANERSCMDCSRGFRIRDLLVRWGS